MSGTPAPFLETGSGPAVILIHGWCCDGEFWRPQLEGIDGFRLIAPEFPPGATIEDRADLVLGLVEELNLEDVVLVGHSMGGPVAIETAILLGLCCRGIVGVDTFTDPRFYLPLDATVREQRLAYFRNAFEGTMRGMIETITAPATEPSVRNWIADRMASRPPADALRSLASLLDYDISQRWPLLRCPAATINAAMLMGEGDESLIPTLTDLKVIRMAGVGHFPMLEAPDAFNRLLGAALSPMPAE
ncbi:Arylesterase [Hartmannibacter diazotrophicus]|uniref:Arylesterase n=1 Tax=Hartmannibacter diazotrophicus TaxID=1482074 RepID=A0A2C9D9J0_9HYPH|nr:alpha/beta hydrolase [Hartmannibacter diazotrophicus]SON56808.1 Arylesterase [Hartmannibacter diazotrophicus]